MLYNSFCDLPLSYEDALADFELAEKNLRGNVLIDYKQLGLQYKLYSCEVGMLAPRPGPYVSSRRGTSETVCGVSDYVQQSLRLHSNGP